LETDLGNPCPGVGLRQPDVALLDVHQPSRVVVLVLRVDVTVQVRTEVAHHEQVELYGAEQLLHRLAHPGDVVGESRAVGAGRWCSSTAWYFSTTTN
jgi:hypothetical protein